MKFDYKLAGIGWSEIEIEVDGREHFSYPSYLSEPLIDLLEGLLSIIPSCIHEDERKSMISFKLYQEPAVDKMTLKLTEDLKLRIIIEEYEDEFTHKGKIAFDVTCCLLDFLSEVIKSLECLLKKHGFVGYKNTWYGRDFPISTFLKLKYYLNNHVAYPTLKEPNDIGIELEKSNLEQELKSIFTGTEDEK